MLSEMLTPKSGSQSRGSNQKQGSSTGSSLSQKSAKEVTLNYSITETDLSRLSEALASVRPGAVKRAEQEEEEKCEYPLEAAAGERSNSPRIYGKSEAMLVIDRHGFSGGRPRSDWRPGRMQ